MNVKLFLTIILPLLAQIPELLRAAEELFPQPGQGPQKLAAVRAWLEGAAALITNEVAAFEKVWPTLQKTIELVGNVIGLFKPKAPTA